MSFDGVVSTLEQAFLDAWTNDPGLDVCPITWSNVGGGTKRDSGTEDPSTSPKQEQWCRVVVNQGVGDLIGLGAAVKLYRFVGVVTVSVFTPEGVGTQSNKALCQLAGDVYKSKQFAGNITCLVPSIIEVGQTEGWWQVNTDIPFFWDDFS